jgi:hypothetical protein
MKKITLLLLAFFVVALVKAQSNKEEIELMQAAFGIEKKAMVEEFVKMEPSQKDAFWKLYDEYETARKDLGKKRLDLLEKYANNFSNISNESADAMTQEIISLSKKTDGLLTSYVGKIKKVTNPVVAMQFYIVEGYILSGIRLSILEQLPLPDLK